MDKRVYYNTLIDKAIMIKDMHRDELSLEEENTINQLCNVIEHNMQLLIEQGTE